MYICYVYKLCIQSKHINHIHKYFFTKTLFKKLNTTIKKTKSYV